jgi:hypothetical protein
VKGKANDLKVRRMVAAHQYEFADATARMSYGRRRFCNKRLAVPPQTAGGICTLICDACDQGIASQPPEVA